jgi:uncharacterized protein (DUF1778 family)
MKPTTKKEEMLRVRITEDERKFLGERARALGTTMSDLLRKNAFSDFYAYTVFNVDDENMNFIAGLSRARGKSVDETLNFVLRSCAKGYKKRFAMADAS